MPYRKVKPHPNEKTGRNKQLEVYINENPKATMREIGSLFGISPSRVCQLQARFGKYNKSLNTDA